VADHRRARVEHSLRAELASLLQLEAKDPRLATVTVSEVRLTPDLRQARVFYRVLDQGADRKALEKALGQATPFLRARVGRSLGLRVTPTLQFEYDTTPDAARRVDELLRESKGEPGDDEEPA
jgi:ribosome-binding factor A